MGELSEIPMMMYVAMQGPEVLEDGLSVAAERFEGRGSFDGTNAVCKIQVSRRSCFNRAGR